MGKATGRRAKERLKDQRRELDPIHIKWAARHPARARDERQLGIYNATVQKDFGHKVNGTPETHAKASRLRQGAIARLFEAGDIDQFQLASSVSIAMTHARITGDVTLTTVSFETRVDQSARADGTFFEKLGAVRAEVAYTQWRQTIAHPSMVLAMVVDDVGVSAAAKHFGMRNATAKKMLIDALDLWDRFSANACKAVDEATLAAAQAGIL